MSNLFGNIFIPSEATKEELITEYWKQVHSLHALKRGVEAINLDVDACIERGLAAEDLDEGEELPPIPLDPYIKEKLDNRSNTRSRLEFLAEWYAINEGLTLLCDHGYIDFEQLEQHQEDLSLMVQI